MKTLKYLIIALAMIFIFIACGKEYSFEGNETISGDAIGSLTNLAGDCQGIAIHGQYFKNRTLGDSNYAVVQVLFTAPGMYKVYTDNENGFSFQGSGYMGNTGLQNIQLKAVGTPIAIQSTSFRVYLNSSYCGFAVAVTDTAFVRRDAEFTLASAGGACMNANVHGVYQEGTPLDLSHFVSIQLNVTAPGTYNISTSSLNGMKFSKQGNFATTGLQTIELTGLGTPVKAGTDFIPITAGGTSCKFAVVINPGIRKVGNWAFSQGNKTYSGYFDSAFINSVNTGGVVLFLNGSTATNDTSFNISIQFPGRVPEAGTHSTTTFLLPTYATWIIQNTLAYPIFSAALTTPAANTIFTVTSYDTETRIINGTFAGTAYDSSNKIVRITDGTFKASVQ
ncbi:MAG: hypothetical protein ABIQ31_15925 [Ferruginibacter sp.]